jgi:hypothetical protein
MKQTVSNGLKVTFLIHAIIATVIGLGLAIIPLTIAEWLSLPAQDSIWIRLLGVSVLTLGFMSWLALRETFMERVTALMQVQLVWDVLALMIMVWALFVGPTPEATEQLRSNVAAWILALIVAAFAVAFGFFFAQEEDYEVTDIPPQERGRSSA